MELLERLRGNSSPHYALMREAADEIETLRELLSAYVADETRFNRGEGEPYGSITTETGMRARAAVNS